MSMTEGRGARGLWVFGDEKTGECHPLWSGTEFRACKKEEKHRTVLTNSDEGGLSVGGGDVDGEVH